MALMNKWANIVMGDGPVHSLIKTLSSLVSILWWNIVMDDWDSKKNHLVSDSILQHCKFIIPKGNLQGMTNNVGLTFSGGDTSLRFGISIEQDN